MQHPGRILIAGGGIAGLCAAVYARRCGYEAVVLEQDAAPGGLATNWRRGSYTFETCLHWLLGSRAGAPLNARWREVFDIDALRFVNPAEYARIVGTDGGELALPLPLERMESELCARCPQDIAAIRELTAHVRRFAKLDPWPEGPLGILRLLPSLPLISRLGRISAAQYGRRFQHPLLRALFDGGDTSGMPALALIFSLAWMSQGNAGYPIGGSQAIIRGIVQRLTGLGGELRCGARVRRIQVEDDAAVGVELESGEIVRGPAPGDAPDGNWVIAAGDGHATIYDLLGGAYTDAQIDRSYRTLLPFPSYLQVSLGVRRDLSGQPAFMTCLVDLPFEVDPGTRLDRLSFRVFHFDPTFAPPGGTAVTCTLTTRNFGYWTDLKAHDPARYAGEKQRVADAVITVLERRLPGLRGSIEVTDVSTPATVIGHTGNWQGSMQGWMMAPGFGQRSLRATLPGLRQLRMVGQWVLPGGGLPAGLITARNALQAICRHDRVPFLGGRPVPGEVRAA